MERDYTALNTVSFQQLKQWKEGIDLEIETYHSMVRDAVRLLWEERVAVTQELYRLQARRVGAGPSVTRN